MNQESAHATRRGGRRRWNSHWHRSSYWDGWQWSGWNWCNQTWQWNEAAWDGHGSQLSSRAKAAARKQNEFMEARTLVQRDGLALRRLRDGLRTNRTIVLAAVRQNGLALQAVTYHPYDREI
eukprot:2863862-Amphidinium_carterae.1